MRILLTGATGFVGGAIAAELAARGLLAQTLFMARGTDAQAAATRIRETLLRFGATPAQAQQVQAASVLLGELTEPATLAALALPDDITHVIHCAALATFSTNPKIWASNVDGTLALAKAVLARNRLTRWLQVGTAMCCGPGQQSPVYESWEAGTREDAHLVPYTHSKVAAELRLREMPGLPLVVARPSIVVGHSRLGCAPSPSIFWVFRIAHALERFTFEPHERIDVIPADWCAQALCELALKPQLAHDLYHVSAGDASCNRFIDIDTAFAAAHGTPPVAPRYQRVAVDDLRSLVPLFEQKLGRVNRLLILRALTLYGAFAELNYVFDNQRLLAEGVPPAPQIVDYVGECVRTSEGVPLVEQMAYDFK